MYKFSIDRQFTTLANVQTVKQAQKELKAIFTESDILAMFNDTFGYMISGSVLETRVEGFMGGGDAIVSLSVDMLVYDNWSEFNHVSFFMDYNDGAFSITTRNADVLVNVRKFTRDF